jgi:lysine 2,3-aminomutase
MMNQSYQEIPAWKEVPCREWQRWQWQLQNSIKNIHQLNSILASFTAHRIENSPLIQNISNDGFSFKVTPHMIVALNDAMRKSVTGSWQAFAASFIPSESESARINFERDEIDCIGEELSTFNPVPAITNFYKNRVLFRVTNMCPAYCRYCFRRRMVGDQLGAWNQNSIEEGIAYVESNSAIREVIISGGDPLVLSDQKLSFIFESLRRIPHLQRLRIDSKALTMIPQRITDQFVELLRQHQPLYFIGHFSHISELSKDTRKAIAKLANAGVPLASHTPLLRGISDDEHALAALMEALVDCRVQPYYLIHFIPTKWTEHFRVPLSRAVDLVRYLFKNCGGLATPTLIVYLPDGGGKVPINPDCIVEQTADGYLFETLGGRRIFYPEPKELPEVLNNR